MSGYRNTIRLISLIHDKSVGKVRWNDGHKEIDYSVDNEDLESMKRGLITTAKFLFATGASLLPTSIGNNPSETVYAIAHYVCDQLLKKKAWRRDTPA